MSQEKLKFCDSILQYTGTSERRKGIVISRQRNDSQRVSTSGLSRVRDFCTTLVIGSQPGGNVAYCPTVERSPRAHLAIRIQCAARTTLLRCTTRPIFSSLQDTHAAWISNQIYHSSALEKRNFARRTIRTIAASANGPGSDTISVVVNIKDLHISDSVISLKCSESSSLGSASANGRFFICRRPHTGFTSTED